MKATRFLDYRQALWLGDDEEDLEQIVRAVWAKLPQSEMRVVGRADGSCVMGFSLEKHGRKAGISIHCVKYTDRQEVGLVPMSGGEAPVLGSLAPTKEENFLDRDFFLFVRGNHVISLNAAKGAAMARTFLHGLISQAGRPHSATQFDLVQIASSSSARRIKAAGGVASIQLDLAIEEATADVLADEAEPQTAYQKIVSGLSHIVDSLSRSQKTERFADSGGGKLRLQISVPDGDLEAVKKAATRIGLDIADDEDAEDFVLVLRNGEQIKRNSISVRKLVSLERSANSFHPAHVRHEMAMYMDELHASGQLEA